MKKIIYTILTTIIFMNIVSCNSINNVPETDITSKVSAVFNFDINNSLMAINHGDEDFSDGDSMGGIDFLKYTSPVDFNYLFIERTFVQYVGEDNYNAWAESEYKEGRFEYTVNMLGYIKQFDISKEEFTQISNSYPDGDPYYTSEEIDALYSEDLEKVLKFVKMEGAIYSNDKLYSAEWLDTHSIKDYIIENIDMNELNIAKEQTQQAITNFSKLSNTEDYNSKVDNFTTDIIDLQVD